MRYDKTAVYTQFDSGSFRHTVVLRDSRIPSEWEGNKDLFVGLEITIAMAVNKYLTNLDKSIKD